MVSKYIAQKMTNAYIAVHVVTSLLDDTLLQISYYYNSTAMFTLQQIMVGACQAYCFQNKGDNSKV